MKSNKPMVKLVLASIMAAISANSMAAFNSGSTGANGALVVTASGVTTIDLPPDGVLNYTTVSIGASSSVVFKRNAANTPVTILASGDVTIAGSININGSAVDTNQQGGKGGPGGFDGGRGGSFIDASQWKANGEPTFNAGSPGFGPGGGAGGGVVLPGPSGMNSSGTVPFLRHGTGGAYGGRLVAFPASTVKCAHPEVPGYGNVNLIPLVGGSGGGGGAGGNRVAGGGGGGGGGAILIASSGVINLTGVIYANGGNATTPIGGASEGEAAAAAPYALLQTSFGAMAPSTPRAARITALPAVGVRLRQAIQRSEFASLPTPATPTLAQAASVWKPRSWNVAPPPILRSPTTSQAQSLFLAVRQA